MRSQYFKIVIPSRQTTAGGIVTGAHARKIGRFEAAKGGTIFLDEIGELPHNVQVKLLNVIQDKEFQRVGGDRVIKSDVRIIAATNKNLEQAMEEGMFPESLQPSRLWVAPGAGGARGSPLPRQWPVLNRS